ncbi:MAG: fructose-bisphosphate aldolase, partial [Lactobacillus sp.]|nr:fructose-bisphosphate aldolase [Lactobacillus sp.]
QLAFQAATRKYFEAHKDEDKDNKGYDPRKLLLPGTEAITASMKEMITWLGTPSIDDKIKSAGFDKSSLNLE